MARFFVGECMRVQRLLTVVSAILVALVYREAFGQVFAIQPKFDYASHFSEGLAHVVLGKKKGYIDRAGKFVIDASRFDSLHPFSDGYARVLLGRKWGYIDRNGKLVIEPKYSYADDFKDGYATVALEEQSISKLAMGTSNKGVINKAGKFVVNPYLNSIFPFNEGYAVVNFGGLGDPTVGVIDERGNVVTPGRFEFITRFNQGIASAATPNNGWGVIRPDGSWVVSPKFDSLTEFQGGLAVFADCNGKVHKPYDYSAGRKDCRLGYISQDGRIVIAPQFRSANLFSESRAMVSFTSPTKPFISVSSDEIDFGFIDGSGKVVVDPVFKEATNFKNGVAAVRKAAGSDGVGRWGFINLDGKPLTGFEYHSAGEISEGLSNVQTKTGKWGYIEFK
jgi:hypothetical protein